MQASATSHPTSEELMALGDGDGNAETAAHVRGCGRCTELAQQYVASQAALRRALYRFDCPTPQTLGEYELGLLTSGPRTQVAAHATECHLCLAELQDLRAFLAAPTDVPESLGARARRLVATLFQPAPELAYGGLRGAESESTRIYQIGSLSLTLTTDAEAHVITGLLLAPDLDASALAGAEVRFAGGGATPRVTHLDNLGNFEIEDLTPAVYDVEIDLPAEVLVVEAVRFE
jgi:hypothetical protein